MLFHFVLCISLSTFPSAQAQDSANNVDVAIEFTSTLPSPVKINGIFGVSARVFLEVNSTTIPTGETIRATARLLDPDGLPVDTVTQTWSGFNFQTNGTMSNSVQYNDLMLFQIPWSQATKWTANAQWKMVLQVTATSAEINLDNNLVEQPLTVVLPDLSASITSVTAVDPLTGQETTNYVPNTNYKVKGTITNVGLAPTQPNVFLPVRAELRRLNAVGEGQYELGTVVDSQEVLAPQIDVFNFLAPDGSWDFEIDQLYLPPDEQGEFAIMVNVNPDDLPGGPIMQEQSFLNNFAISPSSEIDQDGDGITDYFVPPTIDISSASSETGNLAVLEYVDESYAGERGTFRGLEPAFISFAVRNGGNRPVAASDRITAAVILSKDLEFDSEDFVLREFNLGGDGIGLGMLAGETINLTWFQQMPDYYEGDYYLLIQIINSGTASLDSIETTPLITLVSEGRGTTELLNTEITLNDSIVTDSPAERPSVSSNGRYVVFEKTIPVNGRNLQQIYLVDLNQNPATPTLISKTYNSSVLSPEPADGSSYRPRLSHDGSALVFYSSAPNLVPGDTNNREDVFLYNISSRTLIRAVNAAGEELNGRSLYPDINEDGTRIVFESDSSNVDTDSNVGGSQIYLWSFDDNGIQNLQRLTKGNRNSYNPSISRSGTRIVFDSFASDLLGSGTNFNLNVSAQVTNDTNGLRDVYAIDLENAEIFYVSLNYYGDQATGGGSMNAKISGDGNRIVFESSAQNLIRGAGIAKVVVTEPGAGYQGNPTVEIFDEDLNASSAFGNGAIMAISSDGINALTEIKSDAISIINAGTGYINPQVRIIPDPSFPQPLAEAEVVAYLSNPEGDVYYVDFDDLDGVNNSPYFAKRISESSNGTGGNFGSRDVSISDDGRSIVYATKSSNLLDEEIVRDDGTKFFNSNYILPKASVVLVGGIGEIEILSSGTGYSSGNLLIVDQSGSGSGAIASYSVDNRGRISSINIINPGVNYNLDSTVISVPEARGGTGFEAGQIRFTPTIGLGVNRSGGGRIYKVEMLDNGYGYRIGEDTNVFTDIIKFEGDGADLNEDGFPDGRLNPKRIQNIDGGLYLEQRFEIDILSDSSSLLNTTLTFYDKNHSSTPVVIEFDEASTGDMSIGVTGKSRIEIREDLINLLVTHLDIPSVNENSNHDSTSSAASVTRGPVLYYLENDSSLKFSALSGRVISSNPEGASVVSESNMLIMGSGYTVATPVVNQIPLIYGYSESLANASFDSSQGLGRMASLAQQDLHSDDIYLFQFDENNNTSNSRISTSSFGTPVGYLSDDTATSFAPSNRFPAISGNGRYVFFSSDAWGKQGLGFLSSNQLPSDTTPTRDVYFRDLKTNTNPEEVTTLEVLYPRASLNHSFAPQKPVPVIANIDYNGTIDRVEVILNQANIGRMIVFGGGNNSSYNSSRYTYQIRDLSSGTYSLQLVAFGEGDKILATSPIRRFTVSSFAGSLPPFVSMADPQAFNSVTSTSVIL